MYLMVCYTFEKATKVLHRKRIEVLIKRNSWFHHCEHMEQLKDNLSHVGFTNARKLAAQLKELEKDDVNQIKLSGPFTSEDTIIEVTIINCEHAYFNTVANLWIT